MSSANDLNQITDEIDFLDSAILHDGILIVEGKKLYVQSERLKESSVFFKEIFEAEPEVKVEPEVEKTKPKKKSFKLFTGCFKAPAVLKIENDDTTPEIELKEVSADEFADFLKLVYPGPFEITLQNYHYLTELAFRFTASKVFLACSDFIRKNVAELVTEDLIEIALNYNVNDPQFANFWVRCFKEAEDETQQKIQHKIIPLEQFYDFLKFVGSDAFEINVTNYQYLMALSFRFGTTKEFEKCHVFIHENIDKLHKIDLIEIAVKYKMDDVKAFCLKIFAEDEPDMNVFPWAHDFDGCSCNVCIQEGLRMFYGFPFNQGSFIAQNKAKILAASAEARAFILDTVIKTKLSAKPVKSVRFNH